MKSVLYVAFLRGINVGGSAVIKMAELKKTFESLGFERVVPILASGNVVFKTSKMDPAVIRQKLEEELGKAIGTKVVAILRTGSQILELTESNPFKGTKITPRTKLHLTFLRNESKGGPKLPNRVPGKGFQVVQVTRGEICSTIEISSKAGTPELMKFLEKEFGKDITTRTWNTILKIGKLVGG